MPMPRPNCRSLVIRSIRMCGAINNQYCTNHTKSRSWIASSPRIWQCEKSFRLPQKPCLHRFERLSQVTGLTRANPFANTGLSTQFWPGTTRCGMECARGSECDNLKIASSARPARRQLLPMDMWVDNKVWRQTVTTWGGVVPRRYS